MTRWPTTILLCLCVLTASLGARGARAAEWLHETIKGDTLWDLCLGHSSKRDCWITLQNYNAIKNDRRMPVGKVIRVPAAWLKEPYIVGGALEATGAVDVSILDTNNFVALATDQTVYLGDHIRTGEGTVFLELISGLLVMLRPNSQLALDSFSDTSNAPIVELTLEHGSMEVAHPDVEPQAGKGADLTVSTQAAAAKVGGAARLSSEQGGARTLGTSLRGELSLDTAGGKVSVPEGYGASASAGGAPSAPKALPGVPVFATGHGNSFSPVVLAWQPAPATSAWQIDVYDHKRGHKLLQSRTVTEPTISLADLAVGRYTVALRAVDADGFQGLEQRAQLRVWPVMIAPVVRLVDKPDRHGTASIAWEPVEHATRYVVEIAEDAEFTRIASRDEVDGTASTFTMSGRGDRYVRVRPLNEAGMAGPDSSVLTIERSHGSVVGRLFSLGVLLIIVL